MYPEQPATPTPPQPPSQPVRPVSSGTDIQQPQASKKSFFKPLLLVVVLGLIIGGLAIIYRFFFNNGGKGRLPGDLLTSVTGESFSEDFNSETINEDLWTLWMTNDATSALHVNRRLLVEIQGGQTEYSAAGAQLHQEVEGAFEAQVDATILSGGDENSEIALIFRDVSGNWNNRLSIYLKKELDGTYVRTESSLNGVYNDVDSFKIFDYQGPFTLKISRKDGSVDYSVKPAESDKFESVGSLTSNFYKGNGILFLHVSSFENSYPSIVSSFDNFLLKVR